MSASPSPSPSRVGLWKWWLLALALITAWGIFASAYLGDRGRSGDLGAPGLEPSLPTGGGVAAGWTLEDLDGRPVKFGSFRGRAVFLNVWATWCGPCRDELPSIARLAANPRLRDVAFVCVSDEDPNVLRRFVAREKMTLPVYRSATLPRIFQTDGIPATFLIAADGSILGSHVGSANWDDPGIVDLLAGQGKASK